MAGGHVDQVQADFGRVVELGDRRVDIDEGHERRGYEAIGRHGLDLGRQPLVLGTGRGADELGVVDETAPQADRLEHHLGPHALLVEVGEACVDVARAGRAVRELGDREACGAFDLHDLGQGAHEALPVDVDAFFVVVDLFDAGHPLGLRPGKELVPEVLRLEQMGIGGVRPDLCGHRGSAPMLVCWGYCSSYQPAPTM